jgi:hypothetical protein
MAKRVNCTDRKTAVGEDYCTLKFLTFTKRSFTDWFAMWLVKTTGDTQSLEPCLTGRNLPAVSPSAYLDQKAHRTSKKKTPNIQ